MTCVIILMIANSAVVLRGDWTIMSCYFVACFSFCVAGDTKNIVFFLLVCYLLITKYIVFNLCFSHAISGADHVAF
jgi:hypothetical protein